MTESDEEKVVGIQVYTRPLDVMRAFAQEIAITTWAIRSIVDMTGADGSALGLVAVVLNNVMAELQEDDSDGTTAMSREARTRFEERVRAFFTDIKELSASQIEAARQEQREMAEKIAECHMKEDVDAAIADLINGGWFHDIKPSA